ASSSTSTRSRLVTSTSTLSSLRKVTGSSGVPGSTVGTSTDAADTASAGAGSVDRGWPPLQAPTRSANTATGTATILRPNDTIILPPEYYLGLRVIRPA